MNTGMVLMLLYVCVLASFAGYQLISKVPPTLHTPLMSGSNAISGVTILGAMAVARVGDAAPFGLATLLGALAVALATVNVVGGFLVTDRMMRMFRGRK